MTRLWNARYRRLSGLGLISSLEDASFAASSVCELLVPTDPTLQEINPSVLDSNAATGAYQFLVRDPAQACVLVIHLVAIISSISVSKTSLVPLLGLKSHLSWAVDQLTKVCRVLASSEPGSRIHARRSDVALDLLRLLHDILRDISKTKTCSTSLDKVVASLVGLQVLLLGWPVADLGAPLQTELSVALTLISETVKVSELCIPEFDCLLIPAVVKLLKDEDRLSTLGQDLQVCSDLLFGYYGFLTVT